MITTAQRLSLSAMLTTLPVIANAFSLGQITPWSTQGEPLDASIDVYLAPHERVLPIVVTLTPDLFARARVSMQAVLNGITARVEHAPDGYSFIHLHSNTPINFPALSFRLRAAQENQALSRTFALNLAPPRAAVPAPRRTAVAGPRGAIRQARATSIGDSYGPVRSGDTLWAIAKGVRGTSDLNETMRALHAVNPDAFVNGDINRLKVGVTLRVPGTQSSQPRAAVPTQDTAQVVNTTAVDETRRSRPTVRVEEEPVSNVAQAATMLNQPTRAERDPALTAKLAALDTKFAAIRARYGPDTAPDPSPATEDTVPAIAAESETVASEPVTDEQPAEAPAVAALPTPAAAAEVTPTPLVAPETPAASTGNPRVTAGGLIGLAAAVALFVFMRRRRQQRVALQTEFAAREAARKAAVAAKAGRHGEPGMDAPATNSTPAIELETVSDLTATLDGLEPEPKVMSLMPALTEAEDDIDSSIAHGRYQDAERLLLQVIAKAPRNVAAKLRLAEVYYITEKVEEFTALADDLQLNHRGELPSEDWRRIMRMGKIIAPDRPLFAGPRAVNQA